MSYGFQINRADGTEQAGASNTIFRHLVTETFAFNDDETRNVDDIPSNLFTVQITPHAAQYSLNPGSVYFVNYFDQPTILVSEISDTVDYEAPATSQGVSGDFSIVVMEYG